MKDDLCAARRFEKAPGLNKFDSDANVLFERNIVEGFPIQDLVEKMDLAMRTMIGGIGLKTPAQRIRPFNQIIPCPLLFKARGWSNTPRRWKVEEAHPIQRSATHLPGRQRSGAFPVHAPRLCAGPSTCILTSPICA